MPTNSTRITLLAPGCFSALAQAAEPETVMVAEQGAEEVNDSAAIETKTRSYEQALANALHQPIPELGALAIAQPRFLFDKGSPAPAHCVCAELIHLQADKDNARLLPVQTLHISDDDADELINALNQLIAEDGLEVIRASSGNCYLTGMPASKLDTWPAHVVANGKIADYLPRDTEAGDWRRLMTEVQMLFHAHPVNEARINQGLLPVNGMWFWGGTRLQPFSVTNDIDIFATDSYTCGLLQSIDLKPKAPATFNWDQFERDAIVVDLAVYEAWLHGDQAALNKAKQTLHEQWILPAQQAVADGLVSEFHLDGCEGQAIVEKPSSRLKRGWFSRFSIRSLLSFNRGTFARSSTRSKRNNERV